MGCGKVNILKKHYHEKKKCYFKNDILRNSLIERIGQNHNPL